MLKILRDLCAAFFCQPFYKVGYTGIDELQTAQFLYVGVYHHGVHTSGPPGYLHDFGDLAGK